MSGPVKLSALFVLLAGIATILFGVLMRQAGGELNAPCNPHGFKSAIIWFELVNSREEVFQVLGDPDTEEGKHIRKVMDTTNYYDFGFLIFYSALNACLFIFLCFLNVTKGYNIFPFMYVGIVLSLLMLIGDALENIQLLKLTKFMGVSEMPESTILQLQIWTRVKWSAIFLACLLLAVFYFYYFGISVGLLLVLLYLITVLLGFSFFLINKAWLLEDSLIALGVGWFVSFIHGSYKWIIYSVARI